ncbi:MAG: hypothetical protein RJA99_579 [Pseudomonadota bacterium]
MSRARRVASLAVGALASAAYLAVVARGLSLDALRAAAAAIDPGPLALHVAGFALVMRARAERLAASLGPLRPTRWIEVLPSQMAGYLANLVLPMQAGELARVAVASRGLGVPAGAVVSAIAVERVVDLLIALAGFAAATAVLPGTAAPLRQAALALGAAVAAGAAVLAWSAARPDALRSTVDAVARRLPDGVAAGLRAQAGACIDGLATLRSPRFLARYAGWCALQWAGWVASVATTLWAAGLVAGPAATVLASALSTLALVLPAAPGYVGTFQLAYQAALGPLGLEPAALFVAATLLQVLTLGLALLAAGIVAFAPRVHGRPRRA